MDDAKLFDSIASTTKEALLHLEAGNTGEAVAALAAQYLALRTMAQIARQKVAQSN